MVWGSVALVALRGGNGQQAAEALKCAVRLGLDNEKLVADLKAEYTARGDQGGIKLAENLGLMARLPAEGQVAAETN